MVENGAPIAHMDEHVRTPTLVVSSNPLEPNCSLKQWLGVVLAGWRYHVGAWDPWCSSFIRGEYALSSDRLLRR